jgi:hypothetical protein
MQDLFEPVIEDITQLVGQQVKEARKNSGATIDVRPQRSKSFERRGKVALTLVFSVSFSWEDLANHRTCSRLWKSGAAAMVELL